LISFKSTTVRILHYGTKIGEKAQRAQRCAGLSVDIRMKGVRMLNLTDLSRPIRGQITAGGQGQHHYNH
jgi:hypothetical protein